jgi:hypothetical protein|tara:strand:- start:1665 stop:1880 length:216 start_codon:yes stop_codon:yes gene_type:complete
MTIKAQVKYNLNSNQFSYLKRDKNVVLHRVNINELNKRLNEAKKTNFYTTILVVILSLFSLTILSLIGLKF